MRPTQDDIPIGLDNKHHTVAFMTEIPAKILCNLPSWLYNGRAMMTTALYGTMERLNQ